MSLNEWLVRAAASSAHGLRFVDRRERDVWHPWSEIAERAARCGGAMATLGVAPGDRVAIIAPTGIAFFDAFFGALWIGAVPVPLYPPVRLGRLEEYRRRTVAMLRSVDPALVVTDRSVSRILGTVLAEVDARWCRAGDLDGASGMPPVTLDDDALGLIQFSSGTTVEPKPVALSLRALVAQTRILNGLWPPPPTGEESGVSWLPLYHDMGLIGCVLPALERPGTLTLIPPEIFVAQPAIWLRTISRVGATISPAPNFAYALCVDRIRDEDLEGVDLGPWWVALNGAEPVAASVLRRFVDRFADHGFRAEALTPVYGLSEAALAVTFSDLGRPFSSRTVDRTRLAEDGVAETATHGTELVSVGRALPGFEIRVVDGSGTVVEDDVIGRVETRGPSLMDGYFGLPEATGAALRDGWLDTGDEGFLADGELFLTGRAKDVVIVNGRNHLPSDIEHALDEVPGVRTGCTAAVSLASGDGATERLLLLVESRDAASSDQQATLVAACRDRVAAATGLMADHIEILAPGTLPRTSSGKIRRQEARRRWQADALIAPSPVTPWRVGRELARSAVALPRKRRRR
jgi:fatty-acyl-CoA synthase